MQSLKPRLSQYPKYFYNSRTNNLIVYDNTSIYIINREEMKNFNLGKQYLISQLAYNDERDIVAFLTVEGLLIVQFLITKANFIVRK